MLAGSLGLSGIRPQLTPTILNELTPGTEECRKETKEFPMFGIFLKHAMHELILFISFPEKISYKCVMFRNVIVHYQCTVTNSFKQDKASPASVGKYYVITNGRSYWPPQVSSAT